MYTRERAVGSLVRKRRRPEDGEGRLEALETTRTGARYRARTPWGAGGGNEVLPRVMGVHLIYREW
jgi:hypothetical protein